MSSNLKKGNSKSCGCLNMESILDRTVKHGDRHTRLYRIWCNMKGRCYNKNIPGYQRYGGRGISVCDEWLNDYVAFRDWALANGYDDSLSIDRIDVDGEYSPYNCRWEDARVQANNRTNTVIIDAHGESHTLSDWAKLTGIKYHTLYARIYKLGISAEEAIQII